MGYLCLLTGLFLCAILTMFNQNKNPLMLRGKTTIKHPNLPSSFKHDDKGGFGYSWGLLLLIFIPIIWWFLSA